MILIVCLIIATNLIGSVIILAIPYCSYVHHCHCHRHVIFENISSLCDCQWGASPKCFFFQPKKLKPRASYISYDWIPKNVVGLLDRMNIQPQCFLDVCPYDTNLSRIISKTELIQHYFWKSNHNCVTIKNSWLLLHMNFPYI